MAPTRATTSTHGRLLRLPWDYATLGLHPDDQLVADAVRASVSIALYFDPVVVRHGETGERVTLVGIVEFDATAQQRAMVIANGVAAAEAFLQTWDWDTFRRECPGAPMPTA